MAMMIKCLCIINYVPRIFWSVIVFLSLTLCGYLVYDSSCRWLRAPPTVGHDSWIPLGLIPFPAVTVCPDRNIGSLYPLDSILQRCNSSACASETREILSAASYLCSSLIQNLPIQVWSNYFNASSPELIQELMPSCYEDISSYRWQKRGVDHCTKAFQTVYIDNKVCYSFNLLPARNLFKSNSLFRPIISDTGLLVRPDWTPDLLYPQDDMDNTVPLHVDSAGEKFKLTIQLEKKPFSQKLCADHFETYQIAVHLPWELPRPHLRLPLGHSLHIAVTPRRVTSRHSSSSCLLQAEGSHRLQLFQHYTQANCQLECRVRCSLSLCGCVPLYLPRINNSTTWCGISRRYCPDTLVPDLMRGKVTWKVIARHYRKEIRDDLHDIITDRLYTFPGEEALTDEEEKIVVKPVVDHNSYRDDFLEMGTFLLSDTNDKITLHLDHTVFCGLGSLMSRIRFELLRHRLFGSLLTPYFRSSLVLQNLEPDCSCDCPPPCTTLTYNLDTQMIPLSEDSSIFTLEKSPWIIGFCNAQPNPMEGRTLVIELCLVHIQIYCYNTVSKDLIECNESRANQSTKYHKFKFQMIDTYEMNIAVTYCLISNIPQWELKANKSEVSIFYKEGTDLIRNTEMKEIFYFSDYVAHFGGLLALFTGLSMISIAELLFLIFSNISWLFDQPKATSSRGSLYHKTEKNRTVQTEPYFITDSTLTLDL
ncbi:hypothetical protein J6590_042465 [Homalodisca vitripennis]|nr:hypothetical protein J6590_042465 [Homalodisca vitripennis]